MKCSTTANFSTIICVGRDMYARPKYLYEHQRNDKRIHFQIKEIKLTIITRRDNYSGKALACLSIFQEVIELFKQNTY